MNAIRTLATLAFGGFAAACAPDALPTTAAVEGSEGPYVRASSAALAVLADTTADRSEPPQGPLLGLGMLGSGGRSTDDLTVE